ncbi:serine/threonine protein phosphatase [Methylobacterium sp. BTF04]|uniref:metallophosphoesterase family protein n=1 Tax=Methylobacterium sp. BTF04 TaxID=2708300 RepID=UPI0013D11DE3|nr:metallophosphoesterase family protein [Methylobacterium sp. BTF04]NEU10869.1 serine/threonine protein phosphatase [Methylobacterium sp. BTF04]
MTTLTYAVGDIHGCADALVRLLAEIERHAQGRSRTLIFLGDYVDRGPDSVAVLRILRERQAAEPEAVICLMGNHEAMMLEAYRDALGASTWIDNGGDATLAAFGVDDPENLPHDVLAWLSGLPTVHADARHYYVHAGFRPGRRGIDPDEATRLWIRAPFTTEDYDFGRHVVHGHTPQKTGKPECRPFRTNLDTGCVFGRVLTAGVFEDGQDAASAFLSVPMTA